jgi:hypothetical protein
MKQWNDARLALLHDHYKDTFSFIREREKQRDFLFLLIIALFGVLFLEAHYPANFQSIFSEINAMGAKFDIKAIPMAAIMSVTWTIVLTYAMRYCQVSINVERQYTYLHRLEDKMAFITGEDEVFCREGKTYLKDYPLFSNWAWLFYTMMFPAIIIVASIPLLYIEWSSLQYPIFHKVYDTIIAVAIIISFALYRIVPQLQRWLANWYR